MAKNREVYLCGECGYETPKWMGRCPGCGSWNSFSVVSPAVSPTGRTGRAASVSTIDQISGQEDIRYLTGMSELDRVLGGGLVKGSLVLLGGDPGIGKSTLLLQICQGFGESL